MNTIRVLLVEEVRLVRELLKVLLNDQPDMHVAGRINDASAAVVRARELHPHVALIGSLQSDETRIQLVQSLRTAVPDTKIVVMDFWGGADRVAEFVQAGAHALILKDTAAASLLHAIRLAASGAPAGARNLPVLVGRGEGMSSPLITANENGPAQLTQREREISVMISHGRSNKEIARDLSISLHTVKAHVRGIMGKLALRSRVEIAAYAFQGKSPLAAFGLVLAQSAGLPNTDLLVSMADWCLGLQRFATGLGAAIA